MTFFRDEWSKFAMHHLPEEIAELEIHGRSSSKAPSPLEFVRLLAKVALRVCPQLVDLERCSRGKVMARAKVKCGERAEAAAALVAER